MPRVLSSCEQRSPPPSPGREQRLAASVRGERGMGCGEERPFCSGAWMGCFVTAGILFFFFSPPKFHFAKTNSVLCSVLVLMVSSRTLRARGFFPDGMETFPAPWASSTHMG